MDGAVNPSRRPIMEPPVPTQKTSACRNLNSRRCDGLSMPVRPYASASRGHSTTPEIASVLPIGTAAFWILRRSMRPACKRRFEQDLKIEKSE
jgi:hypothetical protein